MAAASDSLSRPEFTIFVINLDRDAARLTLIDASLSRSGLGYERVRAIDGKRYIRLIKRVIRRPMYSKRTKKALTPGEIGCSLSHLSALRRVIRRRIPYAMILEDDAEWDARLARFLATDLPDFIRYCDVVKLEGERYGNGKRLEFALATGTSAQLVISLNPSACTAGYAVSLAGAQRLASAIGRLDEPCDIAMGHFERHRFLLGEIRPWLIRQGQHPTNLEPERWVFPSSRRGAFGQLRRATGIAVRYAKRSYLLARALLRAYRLRHSS